MRAKEIMITKVIKAKPKTNIYELINMMAEHNISGIPVVDSKGGVIGIVTESDLIYHEKLPISPFLLYRHGSYELKQMSDDYREKLSAMKVEDIMTRDVVLVNEDTSVNEIATLMVERRVRRLPVVCNNKLIGIISRRDVLKEIFKLLVCA